MILSPLGLCTDLSLSRSIYRSGFGWLFDQKELCESIQDMGQLRMMRGKQVDSLLLTTRVLLQFVAVQLRS